MIIPIIILVILIFLLTRGGYRNIMFPDLKNPNPADEYSEFQIENIQSIMCNKDYNFTKNLPQLTKMGFKIKDARFIVTNNEHLDAIFDFLKNGVERIVLNCSVSDEIALKYDEILKDNNSLQFIESFIYLPQTFKKCQDVHYTYKNLKRSEFLELAQTKRKTLHFYMQDLGTTFSTNLFDYINVEAENYCFESHPHVNFSFETGGQQIYKKYSIFDVGHSKIGTEGVYKMLHYMDDNKWDVDKLLINEMGLNDMFELKNMKPTGFVMSQSPIPPKVLELNFIKNLTYLSLYDMPLEFKQYEWAISKLKNLKGLNIKGNKLSNLNFLKDIYLEKLNADNNKLIDMSFMYDRSGRIKTSLKTVHVAKNQINQILFGNIKKLRLNDNPLASYRTFYDLMYYAQKSSVEKLEIKNVKFNNYNYKFQRRFEIVLSPPSYGIYNFYSDFYRKN